MNKLFAVIVSMPICLTLYSLTAELCWNWFMPSIGAPRVGLIQAYGLTLVCSALVPRRLDDGKDDESFGLNVAKYHVTAVLRFVMISGFGYLAHLLMVMP